MELIEILNRYWTVLAGFVGLIVSFVHLKNQNESQEKRICKLEGEIEKINPVWMEIKERLVAIETTLKMLIEKK